MYVSISQEVSRQHREEIMHQVKTARRGETPRSDSASRPYVVRDLSWEFARYAELSSRRPHE
jgi:hypothetical protein